MFNPMTPAEVASAIGITARDAARADEPLGSFGRGQLMSAYSGSRHLAVEVSSFGAEIERFAAELARAFDGMEAGGETLAALATRLRDSSDPRGIGDLLCELLDGLRQQPPSSHTRGLRGKIHASLRELCDREVELLADAIEAKPRL